MDDLVAFLHARLDEDMLSLPFAAHPEYREEWTP